MGEVVELARPRVSKETIDELLSLIQEAKAGEVIGIAYVALHKGRAYTADSVGEARRMPLVVRVALQDLSDYIRDLFLK